MTSFGRDSWRMGRCSSIRRSRLAAVLLGIALTGQAEDREAARKLLDRAVEMAGAGQAETGVVALMRAGVAYSSLDRKASLALLHRAFAALPSVTNDDVREEYASTIVRSAADLDVGAATEMLRQHPKPAAATTAVIRRMLGDKKFDEAMELIALLPEQAEYPFDAASHVIAYLPKDDPRRPIAFGRASAAFARLPVGAFPALVERFGALVPADLRTRAVALMLQRIQAWKDTGTSFSASASDGTDLDIQSVERQQLREFVSVAREFDRAAVDRILESRPDIATALAGFRQPRKAAEPIAVEPSKPAEDDDPMSPPFGIGMAETFDGFRKAIDEHGRAMKEGEKIRDVLSKDPGEAVRLARQLPEVIRAEALAVIASTVLSKDAALARSVVDACASELERVNNPAHRIAALVKLGGIYVKLDERARAYAAYERALADAVPLWSRDTRADRPNTASRDTWPSVQAVRTAAHEAALNLGASAEGLLSNTNVADLALLARIQMARALLGLEPDIHNINVRWVEDDNKK